MEQRLLSQTFRSVKRPNIHHHPNPNSSLPKPTIQSSSSSSSSPSICKTSLNLKSRSSWSVYLILSTNLPIKTYVGVTTDFTRRLRQHNGELKGGAKASRAGRPWVGACLIHGFKDNSEACQFETKWKTLSRKLPRKKDKDDTDKEVDKVSNLLLRHRKAALDRVKETSECSHLEIYWQLNP